MSSGITGTCKNGHDLSILGRDKKRYCVACKRASARAWNRANPERARAAISAWKRANPEKLRAYNREWRERYPEKDRARQLAWRKANREKARAAALARRDANPEKARAAFRDWQKANPEKARARGHRRRERKLNLAGRYLDIRTPGICQNPICPDTTAIGPFHDGHEPPIAWLTLHPEYDGPCVLRTEHAYCNFSKRATPDWELVAA